MVEDISLLKTILAVLANNAGQVTSGYAFGFLGSHGQAVKTEIAMSDNVLTWAISGLLVGGIPGCLVAGWMADCIGRKKSLGICYIILLIGWSLVALSTSAICLVIGRVIQGIGEAMFVVISTMYLGEMIKKEFKGAILCSLSVACWTGMTLVYIFGMILDWRNAAFVGVAVGTFGLLCLIFVPESPFFAKNKTFPCKFRPKGK